MSEASESRKGDRRDQASAGFPALIREGAHSDRALRNRLLWRCRQGTRELDTLLLRFVERNFDSLTPHERSALSDLFDCRYDELHAWLVDGATPETRNAALMIERIRNDFSTP